MGKFIFRAISFILQLVLMLVLPFIIMLKGSIYLYEHQGWPWWVAMIAMFVIDFILLLIYIAMIYDSVRGPGKMSRTSIKFKSAFVLILMSVFVGCSLFYLSGANAKGEAVQKEYNSLHPLMRLGVGTLVLVEPNLLVTDMSRSNEDYGKMGLKAKKNSLHYKQSDGFVHALDLRTKGHPEWRNNLLKVYFNLMGFNTLRHVGTADHLHVSLYSADRPNAI
ncbi:MAG: hypothetical protein MRZ79_09710 [Bacteroidia bacterium]|nr:hypothetical protein [Bacteroidia bacterium]